MSRIWSGRLAAMALMLLVGCGGSYRARPAAPAASPAAVRGVLAAALPYAFLDGRTGHELPAAEAWDRLRAAKAVCAGEQHPNPHDHWAQLQLLEQLAAPGSPPGLAVGLEMVQQPFQAVLDDWSAGRIDERALLSRTGWTDRWGYDFGLYRPILELARARGLPLLALNAPSELVKRVSRVGVDGLTDDERAKLPPLDLADARHRAWFDGVMASVEGHGGGHGGAAHGAHGGHGGHGGDNVYAAQVVWDESMAEGAARYLERGGRVLVLAGNGHCHDSGVVRRLARRGVTPVVSVRPIVDDGEGNVAAAIAEGLHDLLFVMTPGEAPGPAHP